MDFREAEHRFRWLEQQRRSGALAFDAYRAEVRKLRVTDAHGRVWMPQELTGRWHIYQAGQWVPAPPPMTPQAASAPPPPNLPPQGAFSSRQSATAAAAPVSEKSGGCVKSLLYVFLWAVVWVIIAVVVYFLAGEEPMVFAGVGFAAFISLIILFFTLRSSWAGHIVDIRMERVRVTDDEGDSHYENRRYAYVQRDNGKTKKLQAPRKWQVGDRLEKRRGEARIRHYRQ